MKKIMLKRAGGPEVLEVKEVRDPEVREGEVLVDIKATGLNWSEIMIRRGDWPIEIQDGFCLGSECAGVVEKVGQGVQRLSPGDRVALLYVKAYTLEEQGCYAEKIAVPEEYVLKLPDGLDYAEAAAVPMAILTAYDAMVFHSPLPEAGTVVITASSGSVGITAIQIAKRVGLRVIATTRSEEKKSAIIELGGEVVVASDPAQLKEKVEKLVGSDGVDYIFDSIGGKTATQLLSLLNGEGTYVGYGNLGGNEFTVSNPFLFHQLKVHGYVVLRNLADPQKMQVAWNEAIPLIETRDVVVPVHKTFPLSEAAKAHSEFERHKHFGKLVLVQ